MANRFEIIPVVLTSVLFAAMAAEALSRPSAGDAEPYHARVRAAAAAIPTRIGDWVGEDEKPDPGAVALLHPNVLIQRKFTNQRTGEVARFLLVHCKDTRDISGHYPPNCYPSQGYEKGWTRPFTKMVGSREISGTEYEFTQVKNGQPVAVIVYGLLVLPDGRFVRDMDQISKLNNLRFFYGAGQVQVVMDGALAAQEREKIFDELMDANRPMLDALCSGGTR